MLELYTLHALERMRQRGISREHIEECFHNPDRITENGYEHRCVKKLNDKILIVIFKKTSDAIIVITAFKSTKTHKYL